MGGRHAVCGTVEQPAGQQVGCPCIFEFAVDGSGFEMGLDSFKQLPFDNQCMIAGMDLTPVGDFPDIAAVPEKVAKRAWPEPATTHDPAVLPFPPLGLDPFLVHFLEKEPYGARFQIGPEYPPYRLGLLRHDDEFVVLVDVAERHVSTHPHALALGSSQLVADPFGNDLPLKLGKAQKDIQRKPAHAVGGVEGPGDRDE